MANEQVTEAVNGKMTMDAMVDLFKGFGGPKDPVNTTLPMKVPYLKDEYLADLWATDGLTRRIATLCIDDAIRPGWEIEGAADTKILDQIGTALRVRDALKLAGYWSRLYGGALICFGYADGQDVSQPAIVGKEVTYIKVYPRSSVLLQATDIVADPASPRYGKVETYPVQPSGIFGGSVVRWHWSRCYEMKGTPIPDDPYNTAKSDMNNRYWGASVLQGITEYLGTFGISYQAVGAMMREASVPVLQLQNLLEMAASNNAELFRNRINNMAYAKSVLNAMVLDAGSTSAAGARNPETFRRDPVGFSGVPEVLVNLQEVICGLTGYPRTKLFGVQLGGLGAKDSSSTRNYDDMVREIQTNELNNLAKEMFGRINAFTRTVPENQLALKWKHPAEPTQAELIDMRGKQATTDKLYFDMGVVDADELRKNRFEGEASFETEVVGPAPEAPEMTAKQLPANTAPMAKPAKGAK